MKTKYIISTIALTGVLALTGCEDFLEQKNTHDLNQQTFFDSEAALRAATAPLYNYVWAGFNDKFYYGMGDGRANNITAQYSDYIYPYTNLSETSLSQGLTDAWNSFYSVVAQANNTINNITDYSAPTLSEDSKRVSIAEARFMRGTAYWYIASLWGVGIIYTNTSSMVNNYVVPANPGVDVIEFAIRDLEYAAKYLPKTPADAGRVTCYSAYGMLSRVYLSMAGLTTDGLYNGSNVATDFNRGTRNQTYLDLAKRAALKVIAESGAGLIDNYGDLFAAKSFNNNSESLFQLQWLPATQANSSACGNTMVRFLAWSTMVADKDAWGGATYCSWNLWEEFKTYKDETLGKTVDDAVRRHYSVASYGEFYPDMNMKNGGYTYGATENPGNQGANIKKYVIGTTADNGGISEPGNSGTNTYMMRLAEVYLNYTEAVLGNSASTTDTEYFNRVRTRAKMESKKSITYEDLRHERRMEFAFEGQYWYDLVRRSYYRQQEVINYMNHQQRNASYEYQTESGVYEISPDYVEPGNGVATATANSLILPMSDTDQSKNPYLKPDTGGNLQTVAYEFGEKEVSEEDLFN
ncbi:MAG: RagB/SusD family nutrient uptake outer membrane protein [Bacteroides sp.]|uniref:RagB/SusD family nutrient uptake outer membrane protein n=1 Tax=uncultured Bacteroides sp. TaxID=162156 RepID=UPI00259A4C39|nr:RagB/SusD family nutrient uptake outer membrane protein [uncultured Bacteroides sp.]MBS1308308.1 RagB/SusD family nutrient uptake outer membrane protein [Bacteroides sp.]